MIEADRYIKVGAVEDVRALVSDEVEVISDGLVEVRCYCHKHTTEVDASVVTALSFDGDGYYKFCDECDGVGSKLKGYEYRDSGYSGVLPNCRCTIVPAVVEEKRCKRHRDGAYPDDCPQCDMLKSIKHEEVRLIERSSDDAYRTLLPDYMTAFRAYGKSRIQEVFEKLYAPTLMGIDLASGPDVIHMHPDQLDYIRVIRPPSKIFEKRDPSYESVFHGVRYRESRQELHKRIAHQKCNDVKPSKKSKQRQRDARRATRRNRK